MEDAAKQILTYDNIAIVVLGLVVLASWGALALLWKNNVKKDDIISKLVFARFEEGQKRSEADMKMAENTGKLAHSIDILSMRIGG